MSFPLFFDEHVHIDLAEQLAKGGYDVLTARDAGRTNLRISDDDQLQYATGQGRVLVTYNGRDFYPLAHQWQMAGRPYTGIIVCRQLPAWQLFPRFLALFTVYPEWPPSLCMRLPDD